MSIKIMIVDDQTLMRDGLKTVLSLEKDFEVVRAAASGKEALETLETNKVDVVLLDIRMPEMSGVECVKEIKSRYKDVKVIMLTTFNDDEYIIDALRYGASGYLLKDIEMDQLVKTIKDTMDGRIILNQEVITKLSYGLSKYSPESEPIKASDTKLDLSEREMELASMMVQGFTNKQISMMLHISEGTTRNYISSIYSKIGINDRTKAVLFLKDNGVK